MTVLVDSDILIEVSRGENADIVARWIALSNSNASVLYSPVSVAELWAGARPNEHEALNNCFRP
jgi:predicted nucleic acid-binding protein